MNSLGFSFADYIDADPSAPSSSSLFQTKSRRHEEKRSLISSGTLAHTFHVAQYNVSEGGMQFVEKHLLL